MVEPASVSYDLHRSNITSPDGDTDPINTLNHTLCTDTQVLVKIEGNNVSATIVLEVEKKANGSEYYRSAGLNLTHSSVLFIKHGGGHVRVRVTALTGTTPNLTIYLKRV